MSYKEEEKFPVDPMGDVEVASLDIERERNLYEETHGMLMAAFLMFCLPDLRALARLDALRGDPEQIQRIIRLPASLHDIATVFEENRDLLTEERLKCPVRAQMYADVLSLKRFDLDDELKRKASQQIYLIHLEDANEEEECVYSISLNLVSKRVGIYFRGSVTKKDFRQDAKAVFTPIDNPVKGDHLADKLGVHLGFREYLYNEVKPRKTFLPVLPEGFFKKTLAKPASSSVDSTHTIMKYETILEQVYMLIKDRPGYSLYIAGHSLGAALAVLMALQAAADDRMPKPVTCITSGGPKVGNLDFLHAFEELERRKKLRCLQVANDRDPVTLSPPFGSFNPIFAALCQTRKFRHVGLRIKLREKGYVLTYPMKMRMWPGIFLCDCMNILRTWLFIIGFGLASLFCLGVFPYISIPVALCCTYRALKVSRQHHTQLQYVRRLQYCKESLEALDIDELNERRFARSRWRVPVLHSDGRRCACLRRQPGDSSSKETAAPV